MAKTIYKPNAAAAKASTQRKSVFFDLKPDSTTRLRVLPPTDESGNIFTPVTNHFNLKNAEGKNTAVACLNVHGEDGAGCLLCQVTEALYDQSRTGDKAAEKMAEQISSGSSWYVQALIYDKTTSEYFGPKLVRLSQGTADTVAGLLQGAEEVDDDYFCDPDAGQDLMIMRVGSYLKTRYTVSLNGKKAKLDDIMPGWEDKLLDPTKEVRINVVDNEGQRDLLRITYGDELDMDVLLEDEDS